MSTPSTSSARRSGQLSVSMFVIRGIQVSLRPNPTSTLAFYRDAICIMYISTSLIPSVQVTLNSAALRTSNRNIILFPNCSCIVFFKLLSVKLNTSYCICFTFKGHRPSLWAAGKKHLQEALSHWWELNSIKKLRGTKMKSVFSATDWRQTEGVFHGCCLCRRQFGHSSGWTCCFPCAQILLFPMTQPTHWPAGWISKTWVRSFWRFLKSEMNYRQSDKSRPYIKIFTPHTVWDVDSPSIEWCTLLLLFTTTSTDQLLFGIHIQWATMTMACHPTTQVVFNRKPW